MTSTSRTCSSFLDCSSLSECVLKCRLLDPPISALIPPYSILFPSCPWISSSSVLSSSLFVQPESTNSGSISATRSRHLREFIIISHSSRSLLARSSHVSTLVSHASFPNSHPILPGLACFALCPDCRRALFHFLMVCLLPASVLTSSALHQGWLLLDVILCFPKPQYVGCLLWWAVPHQFVSYLRGLFHRSSAVCFMSSCSLVIILFLGTSLPSSIGKALISTGP